ncbi:MAG TPA: B12-binding domain-containing radical SAM protein [Planctomycetes bacterium]|nr:B12-binding domain-containing radical SAM protein [Planctomycetota bacterium]
MKVLLIYPSIDCPPGINHGLAAISGVLEAKGHTTRLFQVCEKLWPLPSPDDVLSAVREFEPGLIGFSAMSQQYDWCVENARFIQEATGIPTVVGGVHCTMVPDEVTAEGHFDYVCVGEGEWAMLELVERLESGRDTTAIPNIRIPASRIQRVLTLQETPPTQALPREGEPIVNAVGAFPDLTTLPPKNYELFDLDHILHVRHGWMGMLTSRGCPYKCTYCFNREIVELYKDEGGIKSSKDYLRHYSVERIIEEIQELKRRHPGLKTLIFDDDLFTLNRDYVRQFCDAYIASGIGLPFVVNAHVQKFDRDMAGMLARAGCLIVKYGLESGSDQIRREVLWRYMTNEKIEASFAAAHAFDLHTSAFVMFGLPKESWSQIQETIRLCARIKMGRFRWAIFFPFPGTAGYTIAKDLDLIDYEKMKNLGNYFDGSCLKFGDAHDLLIDKLGRCFHWWVNAETDWPTAPFYAKLVKEVESMDRATWRREREGILERDRVISEEFLRKGLPHYSVRYSHVMAVHSDFVDWERRTHAKAQASGDELASYSLD